MYSFFQIFTYLFTHVMVHSCLNLAAHYPYRSTITMPSSATRSPLDSSPCNGELRTQKLKSPSGENTELKRSPFEAWGRPVYCHTRYVYCQGLLSCLFLPFRSIHLHFFQNLSRFLAVLAVANTGPCVGPQNKVGHPSGCRFPC